MFYDNSPLSKDADLASYTSAKKYRMKTTKSICIAKDGICFWSNLTSIPKLQRKIIYHVM
jgi:hypothetical protein